jgi:pilus assembly protein FimV
MERGDKSLSVSYGAFSCTLSGYADPLPILRAIATQIRDLAEHEPDFGTIPGHVEARGALFDAEPRATASDPDLARDAADETRTVLSALSRPEDDLAGPTRRPVATTGGEDGDADAALERLLARTDQALQGPETQRRHETIGHLRTAVEVTRAGAEAIPADPDPAAPYRDALAAMVWPTRPIANPLRTERPRPDLPRAPRDMPVPEGPVTPHRVTAAAPEPLPDQDAFADWARERGAGQPDEILEAAAAFLAERSDGAFSRSQVMQLGGVVLATDRPAREASFRAFGKLLREGRIARAEAGKYALGTVSRYAAEAATG